MAKRGFFSNFGNIRNISFGIFYILFNLWVIFNIPNFVPAGQAEFWFPVFISYGFLNVVIFANEDTRNMLFDIKLTKFLPRFALYFFVSLIFFYLILTKFDPLSLSSISQLSTVPLWLALTHGLTFATTESVIWQGYLDKKLGQPWSALSAGVFHMFIWSGGAFFVILTAGLLFLFFSLVHYYFDKSDRDLAATIGCHTAFNYVKMGLFLSGVAGAVI